ncbi:neo-calmodulin-like isoform X2 [Convolutriloba macropyga]|uniref:neo-calmodulin-like isoform X2 n=1 Tax=Convolutriloba macropyga TaxID=536237 RepID=UPI003F5278C9
MEVKHPRIDRTREQVRMWAKLEADMDKWNVSVYDTQKLLKDLGKDKLLEVYQSFKICDVDESGSVTVSEFYEAMRSLGCNPSKQKIATMLKKVDKNGNQEVEFSEYVFLYRRHEQEMTRAFNDLKYAFEIMDEDGNGFVTLEELKEAMVKFGQPMDDKELETLVQTADANKDGKIDYVEFARLLLEQNGSNDSPNRSCATNHSKEKTASS